MPEISSAWLALIGAVLGGSGLKALEHFLQRPKVKEDSATAFRKELREEVIALRDELRKVEAELDIWRAKYYALLEEFSKAKIDHDLLVYRMKETADEAVEALIEQNGQGNHHG